LKWINSAFISFLLVIGFLACLSQSHDEVPHKPTLAALSSSVLLPASRIAFFFDGWFSE
jgi:hypothetical protein